MKKETTLLTTNTFFSANMRSSLFSLRGCLTVTKEIALKTQNSQKKKSGENLKKLKENF
jgi:hypothetical protein